MLLCIKNNEAFGYYKIRMRNQRKNVCVNKLVFKRNTTTTNIPYTLVKLNKYISITF